jgi:A/G-specific adenine glycosylase
MARKPAPLPDAPAADALRRALLDWYRVHRRELPWRSETPDAYRVLVSELMCQQTRVATAVGYYGRFLGAFPTASALAAADERNVLLLWQGLGYYRRAKSLHTAAKRIVEKHGGTVPPDFDAIAELPGVGRYTAGAIASIAFGIRAPILDGNVARVLARWFAIKDPIDEPAVRARLWSLAEALVPESAPGDFNQAMMELGALVCTPRKPRCPVCPMAAMCKAYARGMADQLPARLAKRQPRAVDHHVIAVRRGSTFVFEKRPDTGLWAGMWQLPTAEAFDAGIKPAQLHAWAVHRFGLKLGPIKRAGDFRYQTTHRSIRGHLWIAESLEGRLLKARGIWRGLEEVSDLPLSTMQRRAMAMLRSFL